MCVITYTNYFTMVCVSGGEGRVFGISTENGEVESLALMLGS